MIKPNPPRLGSRSVRVLVVDDHPLMRSDLVRLLDGHPQLAVVGSAGDGDEALALAHRLHPDVVVMDIRMPGMDGLQTTRAMRADCDAAVVLISTYDVAEYTAAAAEAGAVACLSKLMDEDALVATVVAAGRRR